VIKVGSGSSMSSTVGVNVMTTNSPVTSSEICCRQGIIEEWIGDIGIRWGETCRSRKTACMQMNKWFRIKIVDMNLPPSFDAEHSEKLSVTFIVKTK